MTDYGHDLLFGVFVTPTAHPAQRPVELAVLADRVGLDLVTFQDHPYQSSFLDTWTLLTYAASRTERIRLSGNVLNLPLRPPTVLARAAASLDLLSGGRFELGIGAGGFWDAIEAMGGRRLSPKDSVDALGEAIGLMRELWAADERGGVHHRGRFYEADGAKRGPAPAHDIGVWVGAYKPRMLALTGALADGWLPSLPYLKGGPDDLRDMNARIDDAAAAAGRQPDDVRRLLNVGGRFGAPGAGLLQGTPAEWAEQLAAMTIEHGMSGYLVMADDPRTIEVMAAEVAPATRELVAAARA